MGGGYRLPQSQFPKLWRVRLQSVGELPNELQAFIDAIAMCPEREDTKSIDESAIEVRRRQPDALARIDVIE